MALSSYARWTGLVACHEGLSATNASPHLSTTVVSDVEADQFVAALASAESWAVRQAYENHAGVVRRLLIRLLGDSATAEDVLHDTFVALPNAVQQFRHESSLQTFICAIAVRKAGQHRGARLRLIPRDDLPHLNEAASLETPHDVLERVQLARALEMALAALPFEQRAAFVLCEVEGKTSAEAGAIADASDGTMRARVFLAKKKLREMLSKRGVR